MGQFNQRIKDVSKIKIIKTIQAKPRRSIFSICLLKDKRLVTGGGFDSIEVYNRSYQPQIDINGKYNSEVQSLCVLRSGELLSAGAFGEIKVWIINEDDYHLIRTLKEHTNTVAKVIEMKDGKICSCSYDKTIKIWDNYQCIQTLKALTYWVVSIIEMNNFIISSSYSSSGNGDLRIWDESTYQSITAIQNVHCNYCNALSKLNDNTVIVGGRNVITLVDIKTYQINHFQDQSLGLIKCLYVNGNRLVFIGNDDGEMLCYDSSSNQIISKNKFHEDGINCMIQSEDNQFISCSYDDTINIYKINHH